MKLKNLFAWVGVVFASCSFAFADHHGKKDIVDTAVSAGGFKTLAAALGAADLVGALKSEGPFTVFAPTDEAFAKLPPGTIEMLLRPESKAKLIDILTYHVVEGKVPASTAVTLKEATALNKKPIKVGLRGDALFLNDAEVIKTDIMCSNGVIHVIDTVLLPPSNEGMMSFPERMGPSARKVIDLAIKKGVLLFNHGNHAACAAVYEMAAQSILLMPENEVGVAQRKMLEGALMKVARSSNPTDSAWTLRRAFDSSMDLATSQ